MESISKTVIKCDFCHSPISLPDKGKSKESEEKKKYEPIPLTAILEHGMLGETKSFEFCTERCLMEFLNDRYSKKKKSKSKATVDIEVVLHHGR